MNHPSKKAAATLPLVRCAIYTRKSTEEGLEQEFNSLDAQRESAEAFIRSQTHEGWTCLPDPLRRRRLHRRKHGTTRPASACSTDIEAGKIDLVVCYKVDRLSRSLLDFAKMMEKFEQHGVSFVSITQQFNSATSMGRLVLNVLLSFAQFEREIIAERTRDKVAATRRKGKWTGGTPLLGYDLDPRGGRLLINDDEAQRVRALFALYLEHQALLPLVQELERRGWVGKRWQTRKGRTRGGRTVHQDQPVSAVDQRGLCRQGALQGRGPPRRAARPHRRRHLRPRPGAVTLPRPNGWPPLHRSLLLLAQGSVALCAVRLRHDAGAHHPQGQPTIPLLRLLRRPEAWLADLPLQVHPRRPDRAIGARPDPADGPRSAGAARRAGPGPPSRTTPAWPRWKPNAPAWSATSCVGRVKYAACWPRSAPAQSNGRVVSRLAELQSVSVRSSSGSRACGRRGRRCSRSAWTRPRRRERWPVWTRPGRR